MLNDDKIPGERIDTNKATEIINNFRNTFRNVSVTEYATNIPTACCLKGISDKNVFNKKEFLSLESVYLLFDYDNDLRIITPNELRSFYTNLETWEDYDFCVFDDALSWCIGVTHNYDVIVVDNIGIFRK